MMYPFFWICIKMRYKWSKILRVMPIATASYLDQMFDSELLADVQSRELN